MRLRDLFSDDATMDTQAEAGGVGDATEVTDATEVSGLAVDSRAVKPGDLFFALAGSKTDGARFIDSAIASGAVAIATDHPPPGHRAVPFVMTPNPRRARALAAATFFPRQPAPLPASPPPSGTPSPAPSPRRPSHPPSPH